MKRPGIRKGFVLLSAMLVIMVLGLVLRVAIIRMPSVLKASAQSASLDQAERAAESGLQFAVTQLRRSADWRGGKSGLQTLVDHPGVLTVVQERGNVKGTLTESAGWKSEFRIRFNYQDGGDGSETTGDMLANPTSDMTFDMPFVSVNNLLSETEAVVPRGEGSDAAVADPTQGYLTPPQSVCLTVEGRALRPDGKVAGKVTTEAVLLLNTDRAVTDAVVMAGGGLDIKIGTGDNRVTLSGSMIKTATNEMLRIRTKGGVNLTTNSGADARINLKKGAKGQIAMDTNKPFRGDPSAKLEVVEEKASADFYSLPWDKAPKAQDSKAVKLPGGVYAYGYFGSASKAEMIYFDMSYEDYKKLPEAPERAAGTPVGANLQNVRKDALGAAAKISTGPKNFQEVFVIPSEGRGGDRYIVVPVTGFELKIEDVDVKVVPSDGASGSAVQSIAIVPRAPGQFSSFAADQEILPVLASGKAMGADAMRVSISGTTISADDDVVLHGGITGNSGTITSSGNVHVLAGRTLVLDNPGQTPAELNQQLDTVNPPDPDDGEEGEEGASVPDPEEEENAQSSLQLNVYARKKLRISTFSDSFKKKNGGNTSGYRNLSFKGMLYSWEDVDVIASDPAHPSAGVFSLRGALVAYGNDPESGEPGQMMADGGTRLAGKVDIKARAAKLYWDPLFLALRELQGENSSSFTLKRVSSNHPNP